MPDDSLAREIYDVYQRTAGGVPYHQLTVEQRLAWRDVADFVDSLAEKETED